MHGWQRESLRRLTLESSRHADDCAAAGHSKTSSAAEDKVNMTLMFTETTAAASQEHQLRSHFVSHKPPTLTVLVQRAWRKLTSVKGVHGWQGESLCRLTLESSRCADLSVEKHTYI